MKNQHFLKNLDIPSDLDAMQPRVTQFWNCDKIGFHLNVRWNKFICTYKLFQGELMWRVKTVYRASFWCMSLVFTSSDGKCIMPPIIVHQSKEYSEELHFNVPLDWTVYHITSGYMDRDGWIKPMTLLSNVCVTSPVNNQIVLFGGHDIHFDAYQLLSIF